MILILYSSAKTNRFEYNSLRAAAESPAFAAEFRFLAIESVNAIADQRRLTFFDQAAEIVPAEWSAAFLLDLGATSLTTLSYRLGFLDYLREHSVRIVNTAECILLVRNKLATCATLRKHNLPIIPTMAVTAPAEALLAQFSGRCLMKPLLGTAGIGIEELPGENGGGWTRALSECIDRQEVPLVQPVLRKRGNSDIRALVVGGRVLAAMRRSAPPGQLVTNVTQGAAAEAIEPDENLSGLATAAAKAVGGDAVTVDLLETEEGERYVIEVNGLARWKNLQQASGIDITARILQYLRDG